MEPTDINFRGLVVKNAIRVFILWGRGDTAKVIWQDCNDGKRQYLQGQQFIMFDFETAGSDGLFDTEWRHS